MSKPVIKKEQVKTLCDAKYIRLYDLQYAEYKDGKAGEFRSVAALPGFDNLTLSTTVSGLKKGSRYVFRIRCSKTNKDRGTYYSEYSKWLSVTIKK